MYDNVSKASELIWGLTSEFEVTGKRQSTSAYSRRPVAPKMDSPNGDNTHGSEAYFEIRFGSVGCLINLLQALRKDVLFRLDGSPEWASEWDLSDKSRFLDLGSGYGKVLLHVHLSVKCAQCVGIECVRQRHETACNASRDFISAQGGIQVTFKHGDATMETELPYSHIFANDGCFSDITMRAMCKVLQRPPFYVFIGTRRPEMYWRHGLVKIQPVAKLNVSYTKNGGVSFIYINMEKVNECMI